MFEELDLKNIKENKKYFIIRVIYSILLTTSIVLGGLTVYGGKGPHYSLEQKNLTDEQIKKLEEYAYGESTYKPASSNSNINDKDSYVTINYKGQSKSYYLEDFIIY